jgi:hypothetical protein
MVKTRIAAVLTLCAGILLAATGCKTQHMALKLVEGEKPLKVARAEGLTLTARFLDDEVLRAKFGEKQNPFVSDYYSLQFRRFIVFDLSIENEGSNPVLFRLDTLELQYGGSALHAYNEFRINRYWEFKEQKDKVRGSQRVRRERYVKENVLPDSVTIPTGGKLRGYAVFTGSTPNYGTATLYVPIFAPDGRVVHRFEVPFEF